MTSGLKEMVEQAMAEMPEPEPIKPVTVSGEAHKALAEKVREWSGWPGARLTFGMPETGSPYACCNRDSKMFTVNLDALVLNPHRVLNSVTPFRLRQEAVLTGVLLHECGHARHSKWRKTDLVHGSGSRIGQPPTKQCLELAALCEEPRVEGLMAREANQIGADGLGWTMRAGSAQLAPMTALALDPEQAMLDMLSSYVLRAGKRMAYCQWTREALPVWVGQFGSLLHGVMAEHIENVDPDGMPGGSAAALVLHKLALMAVCVDDFGTYMIDTAQEILDILFPNGTEASVSGGCGAGEDSESEPEQSEDRDAEADQNGATDGIGAGEDEAEADSDDADGAAESDEPAEPSEAQVALSEIEARSASETSDEAEDKVSGNGAGTGTSNTDDQGYRQPTPAERGVGKGAERFLRSLIEPTEQSQVTLTDTPSSQIDGGAYAAWAHAGKVRAPHFFKRTRRVTESAPPVRIAILADISSSMDELQEPTALLSWALSAAAQDLANFAGRGQQIESCLIHWGSGVHLIQKPGQPVPGIKEFSCNEGTDGDALADAFDRVEEEMPGFFDLSEHPVNRLVVQFSDWELYGGTRRAAEGVRKMLASGVNLLNVVPNSYSPRWGSNLPDILRTCTIQRGHSSLIRYNPQCPEQVWEQASEMLRTTGTGAVPAPFDGF